MAGRNGEQWKNQRRTWQLLNITYKDGEYYIPTRAKSALLSQRWKEGGGNHEYLTIKTSVSLEHKRQMFLKRQWSPLCHRHSLFPFSSTLITELLFRNGKALSFQMFWLQRQGAQTAGGSECGRQSRMRWRRRPNVLWSIQFRKARTTHLDFQSRGEALCIKMVHLVSKTLFLRRPSTKRRLFLAPHLIFTAFYISEFKALGVLLSL